MDEKAKINIVDLGYMDYKEALELQFALRELRVEEKIEDTLLLVEHNPVLTMGSRGKMENVLVSNTFLKENGIDVVELRRGGDVTYHGPGQIVGYPIFDLKNFDRDIRGFVRNMKQTFIDLLQHEFDIASEGRDGDHSGVWIGEEKITAIGISVSKMVTMHGFAFNGNTDLEHFKWINPCGFQDKGATSLEKQLGRSVDMKEMKELVTKYFCEAFAVKGKEMDKETLLEKLEGRR
ncbi:MAG TPA: octanoyltransferase [Eubacteriaceae bacterium]|nr:octanoyltransferase [Eubacteriaceae bacterium]